MQSSPASDYLSRVLDVCRQCGADAADVLLVESKELSLSHRMGTPEDVQRAESSALGVRVWKGNAQASVSLNDYSQDATKASCQRAVDMARASTDDPFATLAPATLLAKNIRALDLEDVIVPTESQLQQQCAEAESAARNHAGITNSEGAFASYGWHRIQIATSDGFYGAYSSTASSLSVSVIAGSGPEMQRDYAYEVARHRSEFGSAEEIGNEAATRTLRKLNPRKMPSQRVPVVFDSRISRSLLSQFAAAISGSAIARGTSFLKDAMGQQIFPKHLNIMDDPHRLRGLGSKPFDAEGVENRSILLIDGGVLTSWLMDVRCANQLGLQTTGHASRSVGGVPHPSSTNLYLEAGAQSVSSLLSPIAQGFYVTEVFGMGINLVTGDYSQGASGFWIENGEVTYPVSELTIAGNLKEMFMQMEAADDLNFRFATNAPTLRIEQMMVGGSGA